MFKKYQLKNGLRVLLVESHKSPVLSIQMWVKTGSADEKKGEEGISHFIEHLVFKGSRQFQVGEIAAAVEGAGGELNAYTSFDQTVFYVTISKAFQDVGFEVISEMMGFPTFDEKEIDNEREVVIEEIKRSNDSPHRQASRLLFSTMYRKHPYGIPVIGYADNIKQVSRKTLLDYFHGRYNPRTMTLVVTGDFKAAEMRKQVERYFGQFQPNRLRTVKRSKEAVHRQSSLVVEQAPFAETIVHLAFPTPKASHKDIVALEMFALIFGQGDSSRLSLRLRLKEHLVNYAGASVFVARDPGFLTLSMSLNESDLENAFSSLRDELLQALNNVPTDEEMRKALTNLASEQFYSLETVDGLARSFGHYEDLFGDPGYLTKFIKKAQTLTAKDLVKVARQYLTKLPPTLIIMSPSEKAKVETVAKRFLKDLHADRKRLSKKVAESKPGQKSKRLSFVSNKKSAASGVECRQLRNGITVITRPSFETPVVSVRCASLGGSRLEQLKDQGTTELLSRVWTAGCGDLSEHDLNHKIDEMAAGLSAFAGRNSEGLTITCLKTFEPELLRLMGLVYCEPRFESAAIQREIKAMQEHVKLRQDNPAQICVLEFIKHLFPDHPYGRDAYGEPSSIEKLNVEKVREVFARKSGLTVVASGALDPDDFCKRLEQEFPVKVAGSGSIELFPLSYPREEVKVFRKSVKEQSHLILGYPGLTLKDPDRYTMQVMQAILAGQGGRLFLELRDKASLAYSVSPMRMEGLEGGYFGAYIGCSPEKAQKAIAMMRTEFKKLQDVVVSEAELRRAQRYLVGKHDIELQKNSNITSAILFDQIYGIDFMETYHFQDRIEAVGAKAIQRLAQRLFAQPEVISLVGPQPAW